MIPLGETWVSGKPVVAAFWLLVSMAISYYSLRPKAGSRHE